jgi:hypothetical protein
MLSNRHFKRCFGDVRESAAAHSPLGRFAPAPNANRGARPSSAVRIASIRTIAVASEGRGFNPAKKSGATRLPLGGFLAEPSANFAQPAPAPNANRGEKAGQPLKTGRLNHATLWLHFFLAWANLQPGGCA